MNQKKYTGKPSRYLAVFAALITAFALFFGQAATATTAPAASGMEIILSIEPDASGQAIPAEMADLFKGLGLRITSIEDQSDAGNPKSFSTIGLVRDDKEALTIQALVDGAGVFLSAPQLLPDVLKLDVEALLAESGVQLPAGMNPLAMGGGLSALTPEAVEATLNGLYETSDKNLPVAVETGKQTFTVAGKSAEYKIMSRQAKGEEVKTFINAILDFLSTDPGFAAIYDGVLKGAAGGQDLAAAIESLRSNMSESAMETAGLTYEYLLDDQDQIQGVAVALLDGEGESQTSQAFTLINVTDGGENNLELKYTDNGTARFALTSTYTATEKDIKGTFTAETDESGTLTTNLTGTFSASDLANVTIEGKQLPVGSFTLDITSADSSQMLSFTGELKENGNLVSGYIAMPGLMKLNLSLRPLAAAEATIPAITGETKEIKAMADFQALMDETFATNLQTVLNDLGLAGLMPQATPDAGSSDFSVVETTETSAP